MMRTAAIRLSDWRLIPYAWVSPSNRLSTHRRLPSANLRGDRCRLRAQSVEMLRKRWQQQREFRWIGGHPALDFVNTVNWWQDGTPMHDRLTKYFDLIRWGEESGLLPARRGGTLRALAVREHDAAQRTLRRIRDLRGALRTGLLMRAAIARGEDPPASTPQPAALSASVSTMNAALSEAVTSWRLAPLGGEWIYTTIERNLAGPAPLAVLRGADLMTSRDVRRVRSCDDPRCGALFLDTSSGVGRRWCDMATCGNRAKARGYRERHWRAG